MINNDHNTIQEEEEVSYTTESAIEHKKRVIKEPPCKVTKQKRKRKTVTKTLTIRIKRTKKH